MNYQLARARWVAGLSLLMMAGPLAKASTVWTGPVTNYTQPPPNDGTTAAQQDQIMPDLWLTRAMRAPMFNAAPPYNETSYNGTTSPENTEWAMGNLSDYATLTYAPWPTVIGGESSGPDAPLYENLPGQQLVCHIISDDIYFSIVFSAWAHGDVGGYSYARSTPDAALPAPTVEVSRPAGGATFIAPANVTLTADASVSSGTVTNVAFFAGVTLLGSAQSSPFTITSPVLTAGNYGLTAVATAGGLSTTSAVVNISVVTALAVSNSAPALRGGQFAFAYSANVGLTYVVQRSSNFSTWVPVQTNVAASNPALYTESAAATGARFYRVILQPNP